MLKLKSVKIVLYNPAWLLFVLLLPPPPIMMMAL
jgi:hypothetical protein